MHRTSRCIEDCCESGCMYLPLGGDAPVDERWLGHLKEAGACGERTVRHRCHDGESVNRSNHIESTAAGVYRPTIEPISACRQTSLVPAKPSRGHQSRFDGDIPLAPPFEDGV